MNLQKKWYAWLKMPERIAIEAQTAKDLAALLWESLNDDNKVSLYVSYIDIESGAADSVIINKNV